MPAEIPDGAVIVARAILNSSLWDMRPEDRVVAVTCIALCNYQAKDAWVGNSLAHLERGQFVRSWQKLARACNLSVKRTRTSIARLEKSEFLTRKRAGRYSVYTLPKYDFYQDLTNYSDSTGKKAGSNPARTGQRGSRKGPKSGQQPGNRQEGEERRKKEAGDSSPQTPPFNAVAYVETLDPAQCGSVLRMFQASNAQMDPELRTALERKAKDGAAERKAEAGRQQTPA